MENKLFNYKIIQRTTLEGAEDLLNMYGVQGWKLVFDGSVYFLDN